MCCVQIMHICCYEYNKRCAALSKYAHNKLIKILFYISYSSYALHSTAPPATTCCYLPHVPFAAHRICT